MCHGESSIAMSVLPVEKAKSVPKKLRGRS
jgi:hypothetical protein